MKFLQYSAIILFSSCFFFTAYKLYKPDASVHISQTTKIVDRTSNFFVTFRINWENRKKNIPVFAFNLDNIDQTLGIYKSSRDYSSLFNDLKKGDTITVFYTPASDNAVNTHVYQIEKNGQIVFDYNDHPRNYSAALIAIALIGLFTLLFGIYKIRNT